MSSRLEAIDLLGQLSDDPRIDWQLRELASSSELGTRISAYEALCDRAERDRTRQLIEMTQDLAYQSEPRYLSQLHQSTSTKKHPTGERAGSVS
ncbi:MAG: hypothetical protein R3B58_14150 [Phycisphaerales bacterium]